MSGILETFGLKKHLNLTINMEKSEFINFLELKVKPNRLFFFDIFVGEQREFYGKIILEKFWLRKKSQSLFPESPFASAEGKIKSSCDKTMVEVKIIGWNWFVIFWLLGVTLVFALLLNEIIRTESYGVLLLFTPVFLIIYFLGLFNMRKGVKKLELYIITELK